MRAVFEVLARIADADVPVLLTGETGTGKTTIAAALHARSRRASAPFVPLLVPASENGQTPPTPRAITSPCSTATPAMPR